MKSGLPSGHLRHLRGTVARPPRAARSCSASSWLDVGARAGRAGSARVGREPRHPTVGRSPSSSGRASATNRTGTSRTRDASVSSRSSWLASAQWMSSNRSVVESAAPPVTRRRRARKRRASLDPRPCPRCRHREALRAAVRAPPQPLGPRAVRPLPRALPVPRRARRCRRSLPSASRVGRRRCRARSPHTASLDREEHVPPGRRRAWPAPGRAATSRSPQARTRSQAGRGPPRSPCPRFRSARRAHARDRPWEPGLWAARRSGTSPSPRARLGRARSCPSQAPVGPAGTR